DSRGGFQMAQPYSVTTEWGIKLVPRETWQEASQKRYTNQLSEVLRGTASNPGGVAGNPVGKVILAHIADRISKGGRKVTIVPSTVQGNAGAATVAGQEDHAAPKGEHYYLNKDDNPRTLQNERFDQSKSKGT